MFEKSLVIMWSGPGVLCNSTYNSVLNELFDKQYKVSPHDILLWIKTRSDLSAKIKAVKQTTSRTPHK